MYLTARLECDYTETVRIFNLFFPKENIMALTASLFFANYSAPVLIEEVEKVIVRKGTPNDGVTRILEVVIQHQHADVAATTIDGQHVLMVQVTTEGADEDLVTSRNLALTTYSYQPIDARPQDAR